MKALLALPLIIVLALLISWVANIVKLTDCDFQAPFRCEVVHGIGVIPAVSLVTVWFNSDKALP